MTIATTNGQEVVEGHIGEKPAGQHDDQRLAHDGEEDTDPASRTAAPTSTGWTTTPMTPMTAAKTRGTHGRSVWKPGSNQSQIHTAGTVTSTHSR